MTAVQTPLSSETAWPSLPWEPWRETCSTLHMWTQVVGKIRLAQEPLINHWWNVPLYVSARGLTTSAMPHGARRFEIEFDFVDHRLVIVEDRGGMVHLPLVAQPTKTFYRRVMDALRALDLEVEIWTTPVEVPDPIPFEEDDQHASYDPESANRFFRVMTQIDRVMTDFRAPFLGKVSPVHFFWGSFDLAVTRFSGRRAPRHPGIPGVSDLITHEAYSHEVSSAGFWPGTADFPEPAFYAYAYPEPPGYAESAVEPAAAYYSHDLGEHVLRYHDVIAAEDPEADLRAFFDSTYDAAADLGKWDRESLERVSMMPGAA
ncbi:MAG: DUF5996 family protein [Acidobacteriota bacterium]